jgi:hypothetical protein
VKKHAKTIKSLHIDGEDVSSTEIESVIAPIDEFEELSIYFGQELQDNFIYEVSKRAKSEVLKLLTLRKTYEITN